MCRCSYGCMQSQSELTKTLIRKMYLCNIIAFQGDLSFRNETRDYFCPGRYERIQYGHDTLYYNDMATLVFNSQETAIKQLFHQSGEPSDHVNVI